ncbi:MAG: hypothetical protein IIX90_03910 [Clostridia bacterium]|nr:hypothetical protein [Clostridia bacterium]
MALPFRAVLGAACPVSVKNILKESFDINKIKMRTDSAVFSGKLRIGCFSNFFEGYDKIFDAARKRSSQRLGLERHHKIASLDFPKL